MKDPGSIPIAFDQVAGYLPVPCPNFQLFQQQKQLGQYPHHIVSQGHNHCQQLFFSDLDHVVRQGQSVSVGSSNPSSVVEAGKMSSGEVRRVSRQDIQLVQNLIERCLQLYMTQKEVVYTLLDQAKIEPGFTELVWQKLEEENREFFKAYHVRLMVKNQILDFNKLLKQQIELMQNIYPAAVSTTPISNGCHSTLQRTTCYVPGHSVTPSSTPEKIHQPIGGLSSVLINGEVAPMHRSMHGIDEIPTHNGRMDMSSNMLLGQNTQLATLQGANGVSIKSEPGYSNAPAFTFGGDTSAMETRPTIGDASTSFSSTESNSQVFTGPLLDTDISSSYGFLGQITRNVSLSDLTADFSQSSDILESYSRSPFLAHDTNDFMDSPERECQGEERRLDTISEGLSYEEFGSD